MMKMNKMKETVLVTGGTGFLGSYLVHGLLENDYHVIILKRSTSNVWRIYDVVNTVKMYDMDINALESIFTDQHIDIIIHTACCYGRNNESISSIVDTNVMMGLKLFELADKFNTDTFFNTDTLLQKYLGFYSLSKKHLVEWLKQLAGKIQIINMKLEHMYGPKDAKIKFIPWVIDQLDQNQEQIKLTGGIQERDFVYVTDVTKAYLTVLEHRRMVEDYCEFEVGTGQAVTVREFTTELARQYKKLHPDNATELIFGSIPYREGERMKIMVDTKKLRDMGWLPEFSFKEGIKNIIAVSL
jgi:nucleoside-diphosphate-sugar epimerase